MTATVARVAPNPKRTLTPADEASILRAKAAYDGTYAAYQAAVLASLRNGAGVRSVAELTGLSTNTIMRWKKEAQ